MDPEVVMDPEIAKAKVVNAIGKSTQLNDLEIKELIRLLEGSSTIFQDRVLAAVRAPRLSIVPEPKEALVVGPPPVADPPPALEQAPKNELRTNGSVTARAGSSRVTPASRGDMDRLDEIQPAATYIPWKVTDLPIRPYEGHWSFNPSIHFDGELWRCVLRCPDYAMPNGRLIRGPRANVNYVVTKNAMAILDPKTWKPVEVFEMHELDGYPRVPACASRGFEDMRIFCTDTGGLQGIAASLHLDRSMSAPPSALAYRTLPQGGRNKVLQRTQPALERSGIGKPAAGSHPPEQALLTFDDEYNVIDAVPLRGAWSGQAQKNWAPFDGCTEPRFLYSIDHGTLHDTHGPLIAASAAKPASPNNRGNTEVRLMSRAVAVNAGRSSPVGYEGIRGGSQLVHVGDGMWLGIGHEMRFSGGLKVYWHLWYATDSMGKLLAKSPAMKLAPETGIEFAAGLAIDGDRVVVSYGVDDAVCRLGETSLAAVLSILQPVEFA